jgi:transcriptional antiterminator RfaH
MNWYVIYTKQKCEDSASRLLQSAGIQTLCPKIRVRKRVRGKYGEFTEQLFPSYLFALFDKDKLSHMIKFTRGVRYIVGKESPIAVHQQLIDAIKERMEGEIVVPLPEDMRRGDRVLIREGPFKDFYAIFERDIPGKERSMILLEALYCSVDIEKRSLKKA